MNLSDNWVSSGSALWFIRESRFVSASRMWLGNSCHVGGTGFMFSQEIMRRNNGWKFHLLTEDLEFTMDSVLHGDRIGYCGTAILYDEQPVTFAQKLASTPALEQGLPAGVPLLRTGVDQARGQGT